MSNPFGQGTRLSFSVLNKNGHIPTREIARSIASNQSLEWVAVDEGLDIENKHLIYEAIQENEAIRKLNFENMKIAVAVAVGLRVNQMKNLNEFRFFHSSEMTMEEIRWIGRIVSACPSLKKLVLYLCRIDCEKAVALCESLSQSQSLESLELSHNNIGNRGVAAVAEYISTNQGFKKLNIEWNKIGDEGFVALGKALERNVSLQRLALTKRNIVTDVGIRAILDGVKDHPTLGHVKIGLLSNISQKDELDFYLERNNHAKPILHANLPLSLWPRVLKRADDCRHVGDRLRAPDLLYHFVKEKTELFSRGPSNRKRKRDA